MGFRRFCRTVRNSAGFPAKLTPTCILNGLEGGAEDINRREGSALRCSIARAMTGLSLLAASGMRDMMDGVQGDEGLHQNSFRLQLRGAFLFVGSRALIGTNDAK